MRERHDQETAEEREPRLASMRERRDQETAEERDQHLASMREVCKLLLTLSTCIHCRYTQESPTKREQRLVSTRSARRQESLQLNERRQSNHRLQYRQLHETNTSTRESYLHEGTLGTRSMTGESRMGTEKHGKFPKKKQEQQHHMHCNVCMEMWPVRTRLQNPYTCLRCSRDKNNPKIFSKENDMDPGDLPPCLEGMTEVEEMLIARACPIIPQKIQQFLNKLPP